MEPIITNGVEMTELEYISYLNRTKTPHWSDNMAGTADSDDPEDNWVTDLLEIAGL